MDNYILFHEKLVRLGCFLAVFALMALWETLASRREEKFSRILRWPHNLGLTLLNTFILRLLFPAAAMGAAYLSGRLGFGLFNWTPVPGAFEVVFTVVVMDWILYYQHRLYHAVPLFWKFHRAHHTDLEMDVTTAFRFHPFEPLFTTLVQSALVMVLGAPPIGVFYFAVIQNAVTLFSHSNVRVPAWLDKALRWVIVTPDMHRIHHSVIPAEFNSNFGFIFTFWDRLLFTYRPTAKAGAENMKLGLDVFNGEKYLNIVELLKLPLLDNQGRFAWNNLTRQDR